MHFEDLRESRTQFMSEMTIRIPEAGVAVTGGKLIQALKNSKNGKSHEPGKILEAPKGWVLR